MELSPIRDSISGLWAAGQSPFSQNVISGGAKSANLHTRNLQINSTANPPVSLETEENQIMEDVDRTEICAPLPVLARTGDMATFSSSSELRIGRNYSTNSSSLTSSRATAGITATIAGSTTTNLSTVLISSGRDQIVEKNVERTTRHSSRETAAATRDPASGATTMATGRRSRAAAFEGEAELKFENSVKDWEEYTEACAFPVYITEDDGTYSESSCRMTEYRKIPLSVARKHAVLTEDNEWIWHPDSLPWLELCALRNRVVPKMPPDTKVHVIIDVGTQEEWFETTRERAEQLFHAKPCQGDFASPL
jgi:hypothetical protein